MDNHIDINDHLSHSRPTPERVIVILYSHPLLKLDGAKTHVSHVFCSSFVRKTLHDLQKDNKSGGKISQGQTVFLSTRFVYCVEPYVTKALNANILITLKMCHRDTLLDVT